MLYDENRNGNVNGKNIERKQQKQYLNNLMLIGETRTFEFTGYSRVLLKINHPNLHSDVESFETTIPDNVDGGNMYFSHQKDSSFCKKLKLLFEKGQKKVTITRKESQYDKGYFLIEDKVLDGKIFKCKISEIPEIKKLINEDEVKNLYTEIIQRLKEALDTESIGYKPDENQGYSKTLAYMLRKSNDINGYKIEIDERENVIYSRKILL